MTQQNGSARNIQRATQPIWMDLPMRRYDCSQTDIEEALALLKRPQFRTDAEAQRREEYARREKQAGVDRQEYESRYPVTRFE